MFEQARHTVARMMVVVMVVASLAAAGPPVRTERLELDPATDEWVEIAPPEPGTANGDLQLAQILHNDGDHNKALRAVNGWIKTYGDVHELYPSALLLRCAAQVAKRDYYKAHLGLGDFLNAFIGTEYIEEALTIEFAIAEVFLSGTRRKFVGLRILGAKDLGIEILDDISANYPETSLAQLAIMTKANYYYRRGEYPLAEVEYAALVQRYPQGRYARAAMLRSAHAALGSFVGVKFDDAPLIEAQERFSQYLMLYPGSAEQEGVGLILNKIAESRAAKEYEVGWYYERTEHPEAAAFYYRSTMDHWPDTVAAVRAAGELEGLQSVE